MDQRGQGRDRSQGSALFHPLRLALTGPERGPELKALLPLIGRARASGRFEIVGGCAFASSGYQQPIET